jgi:quaternary ammonium compound-resistance protein SugE
MAWIMIAVAGVFEVAFALGLKYSQGFTRLWPSVGAGTALLLSMSLLSLAVRSLPVGTAYAVWTGIGAAGTALLGILLFGDPGSPLRLLCLACIVAGVLGLKLFS